MKNPSTNEVVANETKIKVVKNKVAPPFREFQADIAFGEGFSREGMLLDIGSELDIVDKSGAWYSYKGERLGQGKENSKNALKEKAEMADEIEQLIRDHHKEKTGNETLIAQLQSEE